MTKLVNITVSLRIIRTFQHTISTVIVSNPSYTHFDTLIGAVLHEVSFGTYLNTSTCCWISKGLRHDCFLALVSADSWEVVSKSICCVRVTWCHTFSCYVLAVRICCWGAYVHTHCRQRITPVFFCLSWSIFASFYAFLIDLASKKSIGASVCTHFKEGISVDGLVFGALTDT